MSLLRWPRALLLLSAVSTMAASAAQPAVAGSAPVAASGVADAGPVVPLAAALTRFRWPVDGPPVLVRRFDPPPRPWLAGHRGVDLAAPPGTPVRAAGAGVVRFAGVVAGRAVVSVDHVGGLRTTYEPLTPVVRAGDRVDPGTLLGLLVAGHPGCPAAACLHWGLRRGEQYLDPLALLGRARVRLLPVRGGRGADQRRVDRAGRPGPSPRRGRRPGRTAAAGPRQARGCACRYAARRRSTETCV